jgi:hypothetical protein
MNIVAVTFDNHNGYPGYSSKGKHYHYKTDLNLAVGDQCVVDTPYGTALVTVRSLNPTGGIRNATKWIISKVDRSRYLARIEAEAELCDLNTQLSIELEKVAIAEQRRLLAERYPAIGELVKRIEGLEATLGSFQG